MLIKKIGQKYLFKNFLVHKNLGKNNFFKKKKKNLIPNFFGDFEQKKFGPPIPDFWKTIWWKAIIAISLKLIGLY